MKPLLLLVLPVLALCAVDASGLEDADVRSRYYTLLDELRCPKCQGQALSGSNAPIAEDLRGQVRRLLLQGRSDEQIRTWMQSRYGSDILFRPPLDTNTLWLWFPVPIGLLLVLWLLWRAFKSGRLSL